MKKSVIILSVMLGLFLCFCLCCLGLGISGVALVDQDIQDIGADVLYPICEKKGDITRSDYEKFISSEDLDYESSKVALKSAFGDTNDCNRFKTRNILERLRNGRNYRAEVTSDNITKAEYGYTEEDKKEIKFNLEKENNIWYITEIHLNSTGMLDDE